jgi:16S rRNA (cytosine1402-N4)-methyltransferase
MPTIYHMPVLCERVVTTLARFSEGVYVDATVGGGGHAAALLDGLGPGARLVAIDRDPEAIEAAHERLAPYGDRVRLFCTTFSRLGEAVAETGFGPVHGVLFDLGVSWYQLDAAERGFSHRLPGPLDMRMDPSQAVPAQEIVAGAPEDELTALLRGYGEVPHARRVARRIIAARRERPIRTTQDLAALIGPLVAPAVQVRYLSQVFQALRIAVNDELGELERGLVAALGCLAPGGVLGAVAYHSLEDRLVKRFFRVEESGCICPPDLPVCACGQRPTLRLVTRRVIRPSEVEVAHNTRARSACFRAAQRRG